MLADGISGRFLTRVAELEGNRGSQHYQGRAAPTEDRPIEVLDGAPATVVLRGHVTTSSVYQLQSVFKKHPSLPAIHWDLSQAERLDSLVALVLVHHWGSALPAHLEAPAGIRAQLDEARASIAALPAKQTYDGAYSGERAGLESGRRFAQRVLAALLRMLVGRGRFSWDQLVRVLASAGFEGVFVILLVGFLIGIVVSYLGVLQLASYGAEVLIVQVLGMGILRELGPVLAAIVLAGRTGSAIAAELAGMRISEELDAYQALGIDLIERLVVPRVLGLFIAAPLLTAFADFAGLLGGILAIQQATDIRILEFVLEMPHQVPVAELWVGLGKAFAFGAAVALIACFYGLRASPDTTSLARTTTAAVVASIVSVLLLDAFFAILLHNVG